MSRLTRITLLLTAFFAVDKVLAIARQLLTARIFGLSPELDAFNAANNLPDLLFALISGGALAIAFIPVLAEVLLQEGSGSTWRLFSRIANMAFLFTAALAVVIAAAAEPMVSWRLGIAPGFHTEQQRLVAELMRLNLVATLIFSISGLVMAGLQARQHFLLPAAAPLLYNLGQIFGALVLAPERGLTLGPLHLPGMGLGVHGLVYGVILGACLHLSVQVPGLVRHHFRWEPGFGLQDPHVQAVLRLFGPRLLTMLFIQLIFIARDNLASGLGTGSVSALTYGWMILQVPETLIGTALGTAILPTLSELGTRKDWEGFNAVISRAVRVLLALTLPIALILSLWLRPWIALAFGFDAGGTLLIDQVTIAFLVGLTSHAVIEVGARAFYARQDARTPWLASSVTLVLFLIGGRLGARGFGAAGIAAGVSLAFSGEMVLLLFLLARQTGFRLHGQGLTLRLAATLTAIGAIFLVTRLWGAQNPLTVSILGMAGACAAAIVLLRGELRRLMQL